MILMVQCIPFWALFLFMAVASVVVWLKSPRPRPAPVEGKTDEAVLVKQAQRVVAYILGAVAVIELLLFLFEHKPSALLFALATLAALVYNQAPAKRPLSRRVEALVLLVMLLLFGASFYLSICLGR